MCDTRIISEDFRVHMAEQFIESFTESANTIYYVYAGKTIPYEEGFVPHPSTSVSGSFYQQYEDMIFAKHVTPQDISMMIRNVPWEEGKQYAMYDDADAELFKKDFFVVSNEGDTYSIFKCIYNGATISEDGAVTIPETFSKPLSRETYPGDSYYRTADGYIWKLMCVLTRQEYEKFASELYAPVKVNSDVVQAASNGSIEWIMIDSGGTNYNGYAYGSVKQSMVAGDPLIFSLQTDDGLDILTFNVNISQGQFTQKHGSTQTDKRIFFKRANGSTWSVSGSAVSATVYSIIGSSIIRVLLDDRINLRSDVTEIFQTTNNNPGGAISARAEIIDIRRDLIPNLSSNTDFYKNSSFYIRSGRGSGQVRSITEYIVTGNERRILIDEPFTVVPDLTSRFEIGPRIFINGNGTGVDGMGTAKAIATVDPTGNTISLIEIVEPGINYTWTDILIQSNTGFIDMNTGLDIAAENARARAIISPPGGHGSDIFSELGAKYAGVSIEFSGSEDTKIPAQNDYRTIGIIKDPLFANGEFTIADSSLLFDDGDIVSQPSNGATAEVSFRQGNTLRVRNIKGFFQTNDNVVSSNGSVITMINSIDRTYNILDQRVKFSVDVTNLGPQGTGFLEDELVTQEITNATGFVYSISENRIDLVGTRGVWNVSDDASGTVAEMIGTESGSVAKITGRIEGDIVPNSGKILYVENMEPIRREETQREQIKIILEF